MISSEQTAVVDNHNDVDYHNYIQRMGERFNVLAATEPLFQTDANDGTPETLATAFSLAVQGIPDPLWLAYLSGFPAEERQYHNCACCKQFIRNFGNIAYVNEAGKLASAVWSAEEAPALYRGSLLLLEAAVRRAKIVMPFMSEEKVYGTPMSKVKKTGYEWLHMAIKPRKVFQDATQTSFQYASAKREDFNTVSTALKKYTVAVVDQALQLLETDSLYRAEKVIGQARFLKELLTLREQFKGDLGKNKMWARIAVVPTGLCHPGGSMVGTLLDDIANGDSFEVVARKFKAKMHPLQYQRPTTAPSDGAVEAAEKLFRQMGAGPALARRYARLDELTTIWNPTYRFKTPKENEGVFGHLQTKTPSKTSAPAMQLPPVVMSWDKFRRTVLPTANLAEFFVTHGLDGYCAHTTAQDPDAIPILQWDTLELRNPVSWYVYNSGSSASTWGLTSGQFVNVEAFVLAPHMWADEEAHPHQSKSFCAILTGARESRTGQGNAIFPENLKSEFHGVRAVIEAYSKTAVLESMAESDACGVRFGGKPANANGWNNLFRITTGSVVTEYRIDRWD